MFDSFGCMLEPNWSLKFWNGCPSSCGFFGRLTALKLIGWILWIVEWCSRALFFNHSCYFSKWSNPTLPGYSLLQFPSSGLAEFSRQIIKYLSICTLITVSFFYFRAESSQWLLVGTTIESIEYFGHFVTFFVVPALGWYSSVCVLLSELYMELLSEF